ncbi:hypothetical protein [Peribacillus asahii]|uniref:hypothetical protein n=1 Tax=Peribacillus asahii TaxID=228899 RepID=UPI0037FFD20A
MRVILIKAALILIAGMIAELFSPTTSHGAVQKNIKVQDYWFWCKNFKTIVINL